VKVKEEEQSGASCLNKVGASSSERIQRARRGRAARSGVAGAALR